MVVFAGVVKGVDNKTTGERTSAGFPKILDDDEWPSQLIYDTIGACYQGTIRWVILSNPSLFGQMPGPMAQRQMVDQPQGQRRLNRQVRILKLCAALRGPLIRPRRDCFGRKPHRQTPPLFEGLIVRRPVPHPIDHRRRLLTRRPLAGDRRIRYFGHCRLLAGLGRGFLGRKPYPS